MEKSAPDYRRMPKSPRNARRARRPGRPLYIGQWIRALHMRQIDVVRGTGINERYLSELCSGTSKKRPSEALLADLADFLGIPIDYLYRPPPAAEFIQEASRLDPAVLARLRPLKS
jgi:transcriptional regulator with XRE-family HTH domain